MRIPSAGSHTGPDQNEIEEEELREDGLGYVEYFARPRLRNTTAEGSAVDDAILRGVWGDDDHWLSGLRTASAGDAAGWTGAILLSRLFVASAWLADRQGRDP